MVIYLSRRHRLYDAEFYGFLLWPKRKAKPVMIRAHRLFDICSQEIKNTIEQMV